MVLYRGSAQRQTMIAVEQTRRLRRSCVGVLDRLRLVEDDVIEPRVFKKNCVVAQRAVGGQDQVVFVEMFEALFSLAYPVWSSTRSFGANFAASCFQLKTRDFGTTTSDGATRRLSAPSSPRTPLLCPFTSPLFLVFLPVAPSPPRPVATSPRRSVSSRDRWRDSSSART